METTQRRRQLRKNNTDGQNKGMEENRIMSSVHQSDHPTNRDSRDYDILKKRIETLQETLLQIWDRNRVLRVSYQQT